MVSQLCINTCLKHHISIFLDLYHPHRKNGIICSRLIEDLSKTHVNKESPEEQIKKKIQEIESLLHKQKYGATCQAVREIKKKSSPFINAKGNTPEQGQQ